MLRPVFDNCWPSGIAIVNRVTVEGTDGRRLHIAPAVSAKTTTAVATPGSARFQSGRGGAACCATDTGAACGFAAIVSSSVRTSPIACQRRFGLFWRHARQLVGARLDFQQCRSAFAIEQADTQLTTRRRDGTRNVHKRPRVRDAELRAARSTRCPPDAFDDGHGASARRHPSHIEWQRKDDAAKRVHQMTRGQIASIAAPVNQRFPLVRFQELRDDARLVPSIRGGARRERKQQRLPVR